VAISIDLKTVSLAICPAMNPGSSEVPAMKSSASVRFGAAPVSQARCCRVLPASGRSMFETTLT
jgi:hypothetical protein